MGFGGEIGQGTDRLILAPAARRSEVLGLMRSAERVLILSMFRCDDFTVVDEVAAAVQRGVQVRVLITQRARGWRQKLKDLTALLKSLGADVKPYENPVMKYHAKYIVADDGQALVTSLNFTRKCFESTNDFLVFSEDPGIVSGLKALFDSDCGALGAPLPAMTDRLIVGPDQSRLRLSELFLNAQRSIRIVDHRLTDPQMLGLLAQKQQAGVSVQVIGNGPMDGLLPHGRVILIDGKSAIIGSIHLSPPSLDLRREVAIIVEDPVLVNELETYFEKLAATEGNVMNLWTVPPPVAPELEEDEEEDE